jgi:hypothetical protein
MITTDPVSSACKAIHMLLMKTCVPAVFREFITIATVPLFLFMHSGSKLLVREKMCDLL